MESTKQNHEEYFNEEYMPYIVNRGKVLSWISIPLILLPAFALVLFTDASIHLEGMVTGIISLVSAMVAWYIVDPITMYPILHVPGMYLTYLAGNSKEIRGPSALAALSAAKVEAGTKEGTVISAIAISISIFVSLAVMTIVAVAGQVILDILPDSIITALNYLLPSLFGAMAIQRIMLDYKTSAILIPAVLILRIMNTRGLFTILPLGGGYAQVLFSVILGVIIAKKVNKHKFT